MSRAVQIWSAIVIAVAVAVALVYSKPLGSSFRASATLRVNALPGQRSGQAPVDSIAGQRFAETVASAADSASFRAEVAGILQLHAIPRFTLETSGSGSVLKLSTEAPNAAEASTRVNAAADRLVERARAIVAGDQAALVVPLKQLRDARQTSLTQARNDVAKLARFRSTKPIAVRVALGELAIQEAAFTQANRQYLEANSQLRWPTASILERSSRPGSETLRSRFLVPTLGFLAVLSLALVVLQAFRRKSPRQKLRKSVVNLPGRVLASIPRVMEHADLTPGSPSVPVTRAFRQLASTLNERPSATPVVVTSSGAGEGKSTVAVHLSDALVTADRTVCIVDLNFRRPVIHKLFALDNNGGVTDIISGAIGLEDGLQDTRTPNLFVLTAGTECREREQFLTASALDTLLSSLASRVDQIVIDTPHLLDGPLAATAAQPGTSVVVVVRHLQERVQSLTAAIARLEDPSVVQGFVRNGV